MKKLYCIILSIVISFVMVGCSDSLSEAYIRQICHEQGIEDADIEEITSEPTDSLMTTVTTIGTSLNRITMSVADFYSGQIKKDSCEKVFDECNKIVDAVAYSWRFGSVLTEKNDSLKQLYPHHFRKVEKVTVKFKSGQTKTIRVLFDNSSKPIPLMTEKEVEYELNEYQEEMLQRYQKVLDYTFN